MRNCIVNFRAKIARRLYDYLDVGKSPHPAGCIFVLAGKQERKEYGVKIWRSGFAPELILSVDRFEWRKFKDLNLGSDGGLVSIVEQTPPERRHFLVRINHQETSSSLVQKGYFGTRSESRVLAEYLRDIPVQSLLVVSSPAHLRRVSLSFRRAFRKSGIKLAFVAIPEHMSFDDPAARSAIRLEFLKYCFYLVFCR